MKGKVKKGIIIGVVAVAVGTGSFFAYNKFFKKTTSAVTSKYYTATVKKMNLSKTIQGTGSAYAGTTKDVSAGNNGTLSGLTVKVGDTVTKGQELFVCTSSELAKAVTNAERNLTKAKAQLAADKATLATAKAQLATDNSASMVDSTKISADEKSISDAKSKISDDEYTVTDARAALSDAEEAVDNQTAASPIAGTVTAVSSSNGDSLQAGKSVITVTDMNTLKVNVSVDELDITSVKAGQAATITFDALTGKTFTGSVESIAQTGTTSNSVTTYAVAVSISKPTGIRLGMNANVTIAIVSKNNALVIPEEALVEANSKKYVRVQSSGQNTNSSTSSNNLAEIKTGIETEDYIEVTSGVTEGQTILVQMASSSSSTQSQGMGGDMGGGQGGNMGGGTPPSAPSGNSNSSSTKSGN
ncbi:MAG: efflux RND transporter periplasmic adaptor subunit [Clostridiaceae bacterium]